MKSLLKIRILFVFVVFSISLVSKGKSNYKENEIIIKFKENIFFTQKNQYERVFKEFLKNIDKSKLDLKEFNKFYELTDSTTMIRNLSLNYNLIDTTNKRYNKTKQ